MAIAQSPTVLTPYLVCLSSDTKPSGLQAGHLAYETDTGNWYIFNGTTWVVFSEPGGRDAFRYATKTVAFDGGAGNGATGTVALYTVTGAVEVDSYYEQCTEDLAGAATLATGIAGATGILCSATADATAIDNGDWSDGNGGWVANYGILDWTADRRRYAIAANIIFTVGATAITNGTIVSHILWRPLIPGSTLVAA